MKKWILILSFLIVSTVVAKQVDNFNFKRKNIKLDNQILNVEIADSPKAHRMGLMFRKSIPKNSGMLFIFKKPDYLSFWMKNTYIPLDIGYFDENQELIEYYSMKPHDLRTTDSSQKVKYALEVNQGWFKEKKIKIGTKFKFLPKLKKID